VEPWLKNTGVHTMLPQTHGQLGGGYPS